MHLAINCLPLAAAPQSPLSLHLIELTEALQSQVEIDRVSWIAPAAVGTTPPDGVRAIGAGGSLTSAGMLRFEQVEAAAMAAESGADVLLSLIGHAPLRSPLPVVVTDARPAGARRGGVVERLRRAAGAAGAKGAAAVIHWSDEPRTGPAPGITSVPAWVSPPFRPAVEPGDAAARQVAGLPDGYVLAHGLEAPDLRAVLSAWSWVEASVGDAYQLAIAGLDAAGLRSLSDLLDGLDLRGAVQPLGPVELKDLPAVYRGASAVLHMGHTQDGQELRWAMAAGAPIAGVETAPMAAVLGDAGYLVPANDSRALGAACLTLLVEGDAVGRRLRQAGLVRAARYHTPDAIRGLIGVLGSLAA